MAKGAEISGRALASEMSRLCVGYNLLRATRATYQYYNRALQASGLRGTQLALLVAINGYGPVAVNSLADGMVMDQTTVSRNVRVLQRQGYADVAAGADQRVRLVSITTKGKNALKDAIPLWHTAQSHMRKGLGEKRMEQLIDSLRSATKIAIQA